MRSALAAADFVTSGLLAVEILLQGASDGLAMAWDGDREKIFILRALPKSQCHVVFGPRPDAVRVFHAFMLGAETAADAARWRLLRDRVAEGPRDGHVQVVTDCSGGYDVVEISIEEIGKGRMNRVLGVREVKDLVHRCSTRKGAAGVVREAVAHVGGSVELVRILGLVETEWDHPLKVAAAIEPALTVLDPPLRTAEERRARLALLALDHVLRDRQDAMAAIASRQLS